MAATKNKKLRVALIGEDTLHGREIKSVLALKEFPIKSLEFYDPAVEEEFSKLTQFGDEPKVVHHLEPKVLAGLDLVFLAADAKTNAEYGRLAAELDYRAIDLEETFNARADVPVVVAGVNTAAAQNPATPLVANPNPATIMLAHLFQALLPEFGIERALAFVVEPASAYGEEGIQELADQSCALLGGSPVRKKIFREQAAYNILSRTEKPDSTGFSGRERRVLSEIRRVLHPADFPLSLSTILAPVFHSYSIMAYVELRKDASIADFENVLRRDDLFKVAPAEGVKCMSSVSVAGKDKIFVGELKKAEFPPRSFWVGMMADNLTVGSALNAYEIARAMFGIS